MNSLVLASLSLPNLVSRLPGGVAQGIIWGIMALGVYITFRLLDVADLTEADREERLLGGEFAEGREVVAHLSLDHASRVVEVRRRDAAAGRGTGTAGSRAASPAPSRC